MTFTIESTSINNKYIEISQEKYSTVYTVSESTIFPSGLCGCTETRSYSTLKQAKRRYNQLIKGANK